MKKKVIDFLINHTIKELENDYIQKNKIKETSEEFLKIKNNINKNIDNFLKENEHHLINYIVLTQWNFNDFQYKWIKKEPVNSFHFQLYWIDKVLYFNNLSFSLRSKKNNRPILINWWVVNYQWLKWLEASLKTFLYWKIAYNQKQSIIAKQIMKMVFLWKDS